MKNEVTALVWIQTVGLYSSGVSCIKLIRTDRKGRKFVLVSGKKVLLRKKLPVIPDKYYAIQ